MFTSGVSSMHLIARRTYLYYIMFSLSTFFYTSSTTFDIFSHKCLTKYRRDTFPILYIFCILFGIVVHVSCFKESLVQCIKGTIIHKCFYIIIKSLGHFYYQIQMINIEVCIINITNKCESYESI